MNGGRLVSALNGSGSLFTKNKWLSMHFLNEEGTCFS